MSYIIFEVDILLSFIIFSNISAMISILLRYFNFRAIKIRTAFEELYGKHELLTLAFIRCFYAATTRTGIVTLLIIFRVSLNTDLIHESM
jgi:hypothetical protein